MGTHIANAVALISMGHIIALLPAIKSKLQNLHPRQAGICQQPAHLRRQNAEILGNKVHMIKPLGQNVHQIHTRPFDPLSAAGGGSAVRNRPITLKPPEMVDAHIIHLVKLMLYPVDPPTVALFFMFLPVVERIAPLLAGSAEIVGRKP